VVSRGGEKTAMYELIRKRRQELVRPSPPPRLMGRGPIIVFIVMRARGDAP